MFATTGHRPGVIYDSFDCSRLYLGIQIFFLFPLGNYMVHRAGTPNFLSFSGKILKWLTWLCFFLWRRGVGPNTKVLRRRRLLCVYVICFVCYIMLHAFPTWALIVYPGSRWTAK